MIVTNSTLFSSISEQSDSENISWAWIISNTSSLLLTLNQFLQFESDSFTLFSFLEYEKSNYSLFFFNFCINNLREISFSNFVSTSSIFSSFWLSALFIIESLLALSLLLSSSLEVWFFQYIYKFFLFVNLLMKFN